MLTHLMTEATIRLMQVVFLKCSTIFVTFNLLNKCSLQNETALDSNHEIILIKYYISYPTQGFRSHF